jgi:hypothetical protein
MIAEKDESLHLLKIYITPIPGNNFNFKRGQKRRKSLRKEGVVFLNTSPFFSKRF